MNIELLQISYIAAITIKYNLYEYFTVFTYLIPLSFIPSDMVILLLLLLELLHGNHRPLKSL